MRPDGPPTDVDPQVSSADPPLGAGLSAVPEASAPSHPGDAQAEPTVEVEATPFEIVDRVDPMVAAHVADPDRRRALLPWVIAGSLALALAAIAFAATFTPLFRADAITIVGESHLSEARILKIAGLGPDTNLVHTDLMGAEQRLRSQPWVAEATITRSLPHGLEIRVVEREPAATTLADGRRVLVSTDGVILGGARNASELPRVTAPEGGGNVRAEALAVGAQVSAAMPTGLRSAVATITVDAEGAVVVRTGRGVLVTYGDASQLEAKAQSLKAVIDWATREHKNLASVDVTVPGSPTARLGGGVVVAR